MSIEKFRYESGDTEEWLRIRKSLSDRIGGSELGAIAGHSTYSSAFSTFCQKCGAVNAPILKKKEPIVQGHDGEDGVAKRFEREMGKRVHRENAIMTNDNYRHLKASVDRLIYGERSGLECKTARDMAMKHYKHGDFPMTYFDQCLLYLAVTEYTNWYLAIQVFGTDFRIFLMTRDKALYDRYVELKSKFADWELFKSENFLEWTFDIETKKFVWEGDLEATVQPPELLIPEGLVNLIDDPDLREWEDNRWGKLEAVYYVDDEEIQACEVIAARFIDRVDEVKAYMADKKFDTDDERLAALRSTVNQVWPTDEIDESEATAAAVTAITGNVIADSVMTLDEASDICKLIVERADIAAKIKELETSKKAVESRIEMELGDTETAKMTGWKVTYKMGNGRETCSAENVKNYFAAKGMAVPEGLINVSEAKRSLRFTEVKTKKEKAK